MKKHDHTIEQEMLSLAKAVQQKAYSPYSHFKVGTCIRSSTGQYYSACNVENASYGLTVCAEGNAIAMMVAAGETKIDAVMIIGSCDAHCTPCGACRQRISEFAHDDTLVMMSNQHGDFISTTMKELMPFPFEADVFFKS